MSIYMLILMFACQLTVYTSFNRQKINFFESKIFTLNLITRMFLLKIPCQCLVSSFLLSYSFTIPKAKKPGKLENSGCRSLMEWAISQILAVLKPID